MLCVYRFSDFHIFRFSIFQFFKISNFQIFNTFAESSMSSKHTLSFYITVSLHKMAFFLLTYLPTYLPNLPTPQITSSLHRKHTYHDTYDHLTYTVFVLCKYHVRCQRSCK